MNAVREVRVEDLNIVTGSGCSSDITIPAYIENNTSRLENCELSPQGAPIMHKYPSEPHLRYGVPPLCIDSTYTDHIDYIGRTLLCIAGDIRIS